MSHDDTAALREAQAALDGLRRVLARTDEDRHSAADYLADLERRMRALLGPQIAALPLGEQLALNAPLLALRRLLGETAPRVVGMVRVGKDWPARAPLRLVAGDGERQ